MSGTGTVVLRRTWPQRIVILATLGVIGAAFAAAWFIEDVYESVSEIGRVEISGQILLTDTPPGERVNFLLIGEDSALGLDPEDPILDGRGFDPQLRFFADSITILRVNPATGQAWVLSIPRDLLVEHNGEKRINSVYLVEGPEGLIEAISNNFGIPINHFVALDFLGFREVVDELDGIPIWFNNPARDINIYGDPASGLNVPTAGCHVLDGVRSLQYIRSRGYQEQIDGRWEYVGNADLGRIQRQQDFLVLALERAISRGARDPISLSALIEAGARSIVLDSELTVAELIDLGEAFSEFDAENLQRLSVDIITIGSGSDYKGEALSGDRNETVFAVFRGDTDLVTPGDVTFDVYAGRGPQALRAAIEFEALEFNVGERYAVDAPEGGNVVVYPEGQRAHAETIAQYLEPIPRLVEDPAAAIVTLVLGTNHDQILFLLPHPPVKVQTQVNALGSGSIPDVSGAVEVLAEEPTTTTTTTTAAADATTTSTVAITTTTTVTTTITPTTTTTLPPTTTGGVIGTAPPGESCG
ncbi:MAG: LCP family protein [Acidimicrobiales bacterium]|nr:LCP family protein [Acidimicrobiales bacterium]